MAAAALPFVMSFFPSERAKAAGAPVEVDIGKLEPGQKIDVEWRGKVVWLINRTPEMLATLPKLTAQLADPGSQGSEQPAYAKNETRSIKPSAFAKVNLTMSLLPMIATPELVGEAFFSKDLPKELLLEYWKQTQDDSFRAFLDMVALDLPKPAKVKTPLLVLGAARYNMIGPHEIEVTARAYNTRAEIIPNVAHNSMLERNWQAVAERMLAWLKEQEL